MGKMSKENLQRFIDQVADSEALQARIGGMISASSLIALGAECGCEFTVEDLQESAGKFSDGWWYDADTDMVYGPEA